MKQDCSSLEPQHSSKYLLIQGLIQCFSKSKLPVEKSIASKSGISAIQYPSSHFMRPEGNILRECFWEMLAQQTIRESLLVKVHLQIFYKLFFGYLDRSFILYVSVYGNKDSKFSSSHMIFSATATQRNAHAQSNCLVYLALIQFFIT